MVGIFMMSAKLATLGLLQFFKNKGYDIIISLHDVTNKILSRDLNYIVDVVKFNNYHFYGSSYHNLNFLRI